MKHIGDRVLYSCRLDDISIILLGFVTAYNADTEVCDLVIFDSRLTSSTFSRVSSSVHDVSHATDDIPADCCWHERPTGV